MKEDIEKLENDINYNKSQMKEKGSYIPFNIKLTERVEKLLKAYKEKEIETKKDKETIAKLSYELGKYQEKSKEDEAVIEEMANYIGNLDTDEDICKKRIDDCYADIYDTCEKCIKEYFRNKVKEKE